jgi:hypothetical protein
MLTGVLFLMLVLLVLLLAAFVYQIVTTPLTAVDAPTLARSAAASSAPASALPARLPRGRVATATAGSAFGPARPRASGRLQAWSVGVLVIAGLLAVMVGGWMFLRIAHGAAACSPGAIEVCSQGFVLLTGTQLAGGAIALAGIGTLVIAIVLALR